MKIAIIGTGYVGLVSGACFAELGHDVVCIDKDPDKLAIINSGKAPFFEPGLDALLESGRHSTRLTFTDKIEKAIPDAKVVFIAVGTYPLPDGSPDLSQVEGAAKEIADSLSGFTLIVEKSTVPPGTGDRLDEIIKKKNPQADFEVVSNPEFLREGKAISDTLEPDRIVVGTANESAKEVMRTLYHPILESYNTEYLETDRTSAEMIKYASNAFLATKISFINSVAKVCELTGANVDSVAKGMGLDHRIGTSFLQAGIGYGGSCLPKDVFAFIKLAERKGYDYGLLKEVQVVNQSQVEAFLKKIHRHFGSLDNKKLAVLGLSFKPSTDDMREAPSLKIIKELTDSGARISAYDPIAVEAAKALLPPTVEFPSDIYKAAADADGLLLLTEWLEFSGLDFQLLKEQMKDPVIFDGRNFLDENKLHKLGFTYFATGKGKLI